MWKGQFPLFSIASSFLPVEVRRVLPAALLCEPTDQETTTEVFKRLAVLAELLCATSSLLSLPDGIIYDVRVFLSLFRKEKKHQPCLRTRVMAYSVPNDFL